MPRIFTLIALLAVSSLAAAADYYLDPAGRDAHHDAVVQLISLLITSLGTQEASELCIRFANDLAQGEYYKALAVARDVIALEDAATADQSATQAA